MPVKLKQESSNWIHPKILEENERKRQEDLNNANSLVSQLLSPLKKDDFKRVCNNLQREYEFSPVRGSNAGVFVESERAVKKVRSRIDSLERACIEEDKRLSKKTKIEQMIQASNQQEREEAEGELEALYEKLESLSDTLSDTVDSKKAIENLFELNASAWKGQEKMAINDDNSVCDKKLSELSKSLLQKIGQSNDIDEQYASCSEREFQTIDARWQSLEDEIACLRGEVDDAIDGKVDELDNDIEDLGEQIKRVESKIDDVKNRLNELDEIDEEQKEVFDSYRDDSERVTRDSSVLKSLSTLLENNDGNILKKLYEQSDSETADCKLRKPLNEITNTPLVP